MSEDSEVRDNGPYTDADQLMRQFANWSRGMPDAGLNSTEAGHMLLAEVLMMAGVQPSAFELEVAFAHEMTPAMIQVFAGWLLRAVTQADLKKVLRGAGYKPELPGDTAPHHMDIREAARTGRDLGDLLHDTDYNHHPAILKAVEIGMLKGGKPVISNAHVAIDYPMRQVESSDTSGQSSTPPPG
jgi:hypothetical protein